MSALVSYEKPASVQRDQHSPTHQLVIPLNPDDPSKPTDRRKPRTCHWEEIRVSTARVPGSVETWYGVAVGGAMAVGFMMSEICRFKGMHDAAHIHAVGDGAAWIAGQYERQFGTRCKFHHDLYHVCDCLAAAVNSTGMQAAERKIWLEEPKQSLRASDCQAVIRTLNGGMTSGRKNAPDHHFQLPPYQVAGLTEGSALPIMRIES